MADTTAERLSAPIIASRKPFYCELAAGRTVAWCQCGKSKRQPYCDGRSHQGTGFDPVRYTVGDIAEEVLLCGCKHTGTPPFCDGTHNNLPGGYSGDTRSEAERARARRIDADAAGMRVLDNQCYVVAPAATRPADQPLFWSRSVIAPALGAQYQSQFFVEQAPGSSPVLAAGGRNVILFIATGTGEIEISGRRFVVGRWDGVYIRPGEAFRLHADAPMTVFVSALPAVDALDTMAAMPANFDTRYPDRICSVDAAQRLEMGPRYFQMLVDKTLGSTDAAQFIGHIPVSRAEMHRHLYEEALIILSGSGILWNEASYTPVRAGDVVFLPRKHAHSLECTDPAGMDVVGVIHPGDNPGINY